MFGFESDIAIASTKKEFQNLAQELLPHNQPALFNQAIMEFGALQCVPKNPDCSSCIFNDNCFALQNKKVNELPVKTKKNKVTHRYFNYLIIRDKEGDFVVVKREDKGIWFNLYEFTLEESFERKNLDVLINEIQSKYNPIEIVLKNEEELVHKLSHQHLHIHFFELKFDYKIATALPINELMKLPFPIVIYNFVASNYL